jgi:transcriptional regulator with XRE-family HTH domain
VDDEELHQVVAQNLRRVAQARGLPLNTLADLAGVSHSQLYALLAGRKSVTLEWLAKVADALEVEPWELLRPGGRPRGGAGRGRSG